MEKSEKLLTFLKSKVELPAKQVRWLVENNRCRVNGQVERFCSVRLKKGDVIHLYVTTEQPKLKVVFEDEHLAIYNKPPGLASEKLPHLPVHRLDRDTTGVIVCAKTMEAQAKLEALFFEHKVEKEYRALVSPPPQADFGVIRMKMAVHKRREGAVLWRKANEGLTSITRWSVAKRNRNSAEIRLFPETGRTHQLRLHMKELGCPIIGDADYGNREQAKVFRPLLHARKIKFVHPFTNEWVEGVVEFGGKDAQY